MSIWIGLTGKNGSGKGEAAKYLQSKGFSYFSLSDILREEAKNRNIAATRDSLFALGNELRAKNGAGVLAKKVLAKLDRSKNYIIDSVRHPEEVAVFRPFAEFTFVEVYADPRIRFNRMLNRARENDPTTFEAFCELEKREAKNATSTSQRLDETIDLADFRVSSNHDLPELCAEIDNLLAKLNERSGAAPKLK